MGHLSGGFFVVWSIFRVQNKEKLKENWLERRKLKCIKRSFIYIMQLLCYILGGGVKLDQEENVSGGQSYILLSQIVPTIPQEWVPKFFELFEKSACEGEIIAVFPEGGWIFEEGEDLEAMIHKVREVKVKKTLDLEGWIAKTTLKAGRDGGFWTDARGVEAKGHPQG